MNRRINRRWEQDEIDRQRRAALWQDERALQRQALELLTRITAKSLQIGRDLPDPQARVRLAFDLQNDVCDLLLTLTREGH